MAEVNDIGDDVILLWSEGFFCIGPTIADPPGAPNITGITSETVLIEDQVRRITCISMAGNPLADLKWFRGTEELTNSVTIKGEDDQYSKSELTITVNRYVINVQ